MSRKGIPLRLKNKRLYRIWAGIKTRCDNIKCVDYSYYGGRGITYAKRWEEFEPFYEDMGRLYNQHVEEFGARGIKVCDRWKNSFDNFYDDMIDTYRNNKHKGMEVMFSRYDSSKDFTPDNCGMVKHGYKG